ncbi:hypothetical protein BDF14DRAFT_1804946 [Spinellus fusiger]|nr:hypothetical protein BDF14DRAFT_1804946 [Spinellus fusiger]
MSSLSAVHSRTERILSDIEENRENDFFITFSHHDIETWLNKNQNTCRILILDSSFNPPTLAHRALLTTSIDHFPKDYFDASLLLLSSRNMDKQLVGASVLQRIQMMEIMARGLSNSPRKALQNIAVALTLHGRFVDKAIYIHSFFEYHLPGKSIELYFIMGIDTVTRFFNPAYYSGDPNNVLKAFFQANWLICADRPGYSQIEGSFWNTEARLYTKKIKQIRLKDSVASLSSTLVRSKIKENQSLPGDIVLDGDIDTLVLQFINEQEIYETD